MSTNSNTSKLSTSSTNSTTINSVNSFYYPDRLPCDYSCGDELITKQEFAEECDINEILNIYKKTGVITHIMQQEPVYGDLPDDTDFQSSLAVIHSASTAFDSLPSVVRRYFNNDPSELLIALSDPAMRPQLEELGILRGPLTPQPPGNPGNPNPSLASTLAGQPQLPPTASGSAPPASPPAATSPPAAAPLSGGGLL